MGQYPQSAPELFQLAALFRRSAEQSAHVEIQKKLRHAADDIEARAWAIAQKGSLEAQADLVRSLFDSVDLVV